LRLAKQSTHGAVRAVQLGYSPMGPPLMNVFFYYLDGLLIDTGQRHMGPYALAAMADLPVRHILLTHHHEDHSGNAADFQRQTGATVWGHPIAVTKLATGYRIRPYQHLVWGSAKPLPLSPLKGPIETEHYRLTPVETPGHSRDHVVYFEKNHGWLFSGDLFIGEKIKFFRADEDLETQIHSLRTVLRLDFEVLFCAHNPRRQDGKQSLLRKLDFLVVLREQVRDLYHRGCPMGEIIKRLDPRTDRWVRWITMGNASFANMVRSAFTSITSGMPRCK
jgi:glyoxylase-like metal-dependent hydrolase (beta-lactamase superfamily II)